MTTWRMDQTSPLDRLKEQVQLLRNGNAMEILAALESIIVISQDDGQILIDAEEYGLFEELYKVICNDHGEARLAVLKILKKVAMGLIRLNRTTNLVMLTVLTKVIREDHGESRDMALTAVWDLSFSAKNQCLVIDPSVGLLGLLVQIFREISDDKDKTLHLALCILANVSLEKKIMMQ